MVDWTLPTSCEKCKVTTTSRQKMLLKAAKFPPCLKYFLRFEHGTAVHTGRAAHSPKHVFTKAEYVVRLSAVLI